MSHKMIRPCIVKVSPVLGYFPLRRRSYDHPPIYTIIQYIIGYAYSLLQYTTPSRDL